jgi:DNA-binding beta-propeller fold protein YncE
MLLYLGGPARVDTGGLFTGPNDVAVYTGLDGDVDDDKLFVVESNDEGAASGRVQRLGRDGRFELMWGRDVVRRGAPGDTGTGFEVCSRAVSTAANCKAAPAGAAAGELDRPTGVAVSQATGHVYVSDRGNQRIQEFDLDGGFVRAWGWGVASGAPRFERCRRDCRAGRVDAGARNEHAGQFEIESGAAIAVAPRAPYDVWVADAGNHRVMQFRSDGGFVRAWGWGVATGSIEFEVCNTWSRCRRGSERGDSPGLSPSAWPRHLMVDAAGVVYASDSNEGNRLIRFDGDVAPRPPDASDALRAPLPSHSVFKADPDAGLLSRGSTAGIEFDPTTGHAFVVRDGFDQEPTVIDEIARPWASGAPDSPTGPRLVGTYALPEAARVVAVGAGGGGSLYLASAASIPPGVGVPVIPCSLPRTPAGCDGIVVLPIAGGPLQQVFGAPPIAQPPLARWGWS